MEGIGTGGAALSAAAAARTAPAQRPQPEPEHAPAKSAPDVDRYMPEGERACAGLYRVKRDENGAPKVLFDGPEGRPAETCTSDTGRVDRELEGLRRQREALARQADRERDPVRAQALERRLAQVEAQLARKDNESYRRQNTDFS